MQCDACFRHKIVISLLLLLKLMHVSVREHVCRQLTQELSNEDD